VSALKGEFIVGLSLGIVGPDRKLKCWLTAILAQPRLNALLDVDGTGRGLLRTLYDRDLNPIVSSDKADGALMRPAPDVLRQALAHAEQSSSREGLLDGSDERGAPILIAYRQSESTNWTAVVTAPATQVNAPVNDVARRLVGPGLMLLAVGALAALFTARHIETPLRSLTTMVARAQGEVAQLSSQLLTLQEEERRRMARELHDSTVQHLVAINMSLSRLDMEMARDVSKARLIRQEIAAEVQSALHELRVFTYLLHPPDLASDGLAATLRQFATGFGRRSDLHVTVRIPNAVDQAPPAFQLAILRVVQEALANVHRHARARNVDITARISRGQLFVRIRDDGLGMGGTGSDDAITLGVGIPGMAARLRQFDGNLKIRTGAWGTSVLACVPMRVLA
jgi:signal transduction histidine kinase